MIKIGLIGSGFMGSTHLAAYSQLIKNGTFKVTAIADLDSKRAEKFAAILGAEIFANGNDLIEKADVNTVDICLPTYLHYEYACKAVKKGYNVFVEKPLCRTSKDAKELAKLAKEKNVIAMVGQCIRFWDEYVYLKALVDNKTYGNVVNASFKRLSPRPTWGWENWLMDNKKSGGAALDLHIHDSDYLLHIFGEPQKTSTITNKTGEKDSYIQTICDYGNFTASLEGCWDMPAQFPFEMAYRVIFENSVVVDFSSLRGLKVYTAEGVTEPKIKKENTAKSEDLGGNISDLGGYYNELFYFITCLNKNVKADMATLEDGARAVEFIEKELGAKL